MVLRFGRLRMEVRREERASGISLRSRPVKISSSPATFVGVSIGGVGVTYKRGCFPTYLEVLLCSKDFSEKFAGPNTERITEHADFFDIVGTEVGNMRFEVFGGVELQALSLEGKDLF